jgi:alpha-L-fucosidase
MNNSTLKRTLILTLIAVGLFFVACQNQKSKDGYADSVTKIPGNIDFGKTDASAYTPEIRANMRQLYDDKFGLFVHWGPYAQLEGIWEDKEVSAEWIMRRAPISINDYEREAAGKFKPIKFSAANLVDVAENAGMKFIVITAKHHDGFAMYKSTHPYNIVDFADFNRDVLKELSEECAERDMKLGFYYSQSQDWHEEGGYGNNWDFEGLTRPQDKFDAYFNEKAVMQVKELTSKYGDIFMIWFDTPTQMSDENCQQMMDVVKQNQPGALVNSRLGNGYGHFDVALDNGKTPSVSKATWLPDLKVPWQTHESVTTGGWGYTSYGSENDRSAEYTDFIYSLCRIVGSGGVYLLNVAPRPDGTIPESQANSITAIGDWLKVNGEAIYGADPSPLKFPPFAITSKPGKVYLHLKDLEDNTAELNGLLSKVKNAYCLADESKQALSFTQKNEKLTVTIPEKLKQPRVTVVVLEINDEQAKVVDETIQQASDGSIKLPVAKCEFATRRIGYNYEEQTTHAWGGKSNQGLIWTVNITMPGSFKVISEDNGHDKLSYELITPTDTLEVFPKGNVGQITKKAQQGSVDIVNSGTIIIKAYPKQTIEWWNEFKLKGIELKPVEE